MVGRGSPAEVEDSRVDRSFAARPGSSRRVLPIGRLTRPLSFALPRGATARRLGIALAVLALLGGGWLLLRKSPLVSVEHVQIAGVQGVDAGPIDAALRGAARGMSTLNVNVAALRAAVAPFHVVRDLSVSTSFPHGLRIHVVEQLPVAVLSVGGVHTAVAADGVVLGPELLASERVPLPAITLAAGSPAPLGGHVENATARAELSVLGAAPRVLLGWVSKVFMRARRADGGDAQRRVDLLRRRHAPARQVAVGRARARRPQLRGGDLRRCARPRTSGGGHHRGGRAGGGTAHRAGERHRRDLRRAGERPRGSDQRWVGHRERHRVGGRGRERDGSSAAASPAGASGATGSAAPCVEHHRTEHARSGRGQFRRRYRASSERAPQGLTTLTLNFRLRQPKSDSSGDG